MPSKALLVLGGTVFLLSSCLFNESRDGSDWAQKQNYPVNYTTNYAEIPVQATAQVFFDSLPFQASVVGAVGSAQGTEQKLWYMLLANDTTTPRLLAGADSVQAVVNLYLDSAFYRQHPTEPLFSGDSVDVELVWAVPQEISKSQRDSLRKMNDSLWFSELKNQQMAGLKGEIATVRVRAPQKGLDSLQIPLPAAVSQALAKQSSRLRLDFGVNIVAAERIYRFSGPSNSKGVPRLAFQAFYGADSTQYVRAVSDSVLWRSAQSARVVSAGANLVIHGGVRESLWVTLPAAPILRALDSISPRVAGSDKIDAQRFVLMAQLRMAAPSDPQGGELGLALPVLAAAQIAASPLSDSLTVSESIILDSLNIKAEGHSSLLFYNRDTISLQITETLRHFVQVAALDFDPEFTLRLGRPMLSPKEVHNSDYYDTDTSIVRIYSNFPSYAAWDLGAPNALNFNLHIWWVDRQGGD